MSRFTRMQVLNRMVDVGVVPVFYNPDIEVARNIVKAVAAGGATVVEFTNRGDHAWEVFTALERFCAAELPEVALGVGSVIDAPTAGLYVNCGSSFVVGPTLNPAVAELCNRRKVAYSPGCGSASEISQAEALGCEIVKVFPAGEVGGPAFVKALRGPCPWTSIMPTGGVDATEESLKAWFDAGVACVGMGSKLITKDLVAAGDWGGITEKVSFVVGMIRKLKG
ncbi:MAG TPA: bifunctional 4-hydroxy-2-oxoglutarate aldolase/2-dehydro-3-deoxy-phosphogluconate aldolase [Phycisphaerae bacterium]|nr:bifunctional 4-hydroxy-2-oxoglutarate aldolase/2-dehydro-3-deoxy-phosphogluconate aldolase [Phycisphaerae bacterium]